LEAYVIVLTESIDEGVVRMWSFEAATKLEVAEPIVQNLAYFAATGMFSGISWTSGLARWHRVGQLEPQSLLKAIGASHVEGDSTSGFQLHRLESGQVATDVTHNE
jgi:hypothetical protein